MAVAAWLLYTFVYATFISLGEDIPFIFALNGTVINSLLLALLMVAAWLIAVRWLYKVTGYLKLFVHLFLGIVVSVAWFELYTLIFEWVLPGISLGEGFYNNSLWIILSTFFIYAITFAIIHSLQSAKQLREEEQKMSELRELSAMKDIATLKAQLNPHFLFNTLNSINAYVTKDPLETRQMIANLSDMLRYSLNSFNEDEVRLSEELDFVRKYLRLEKKRMGDRLEYEIDVADSVDDVRIPPMIIQPLVENAVKHGLSPSEEGGSIKMSIFEETGQLRVSIKDSGEGIPGDFEKENSTGIGVSNTDRLLRTRYGDRHGLHFDRLKSGGTSVSFSIPIN